MKNMERKDYQQLARATARWMKEVGAVHDDDAKTRGHVTTDDWMTNFATIYPIDSSDMGVVVQHAHEMGIWISIDPGRGWYLGSEPVDAAKVVSRLINYTTTLLDTVNKYFAAQEASGKFPEISKGYKALNKIKEIDDILPLLNAAGASVATQVKVALIEARDQFQQ